MKVTIERTRDIRFLDVQVDDWVGKFSSASADSLRILSAAGFRDEI